MEGVEEVDEVEEVWANGDDADGFEGCLVICGALDGGGLGVWVGWLSTSGSVSGVVAGDPKIRSRSLGAVVLSQCLLETLECGNGVVVLSALL